MLERRQQLQLFFLLPLLGMIWILRYFPAGGEFYARHIYPVFATVLSAFSSLFPFSVGDCFIFAGSLLLLLRIFSLVLKKKKKRINRFFSILLALGWIYVWFYLAWGLNYFRKDFYIRTQIHRCAYSPEEFNIFLSRYVAFINRNYTDIDTLSPSLIEEELQKGYREIASGFGLLSPHKNLKPKTMLFSSWMSAVGVTGYMGPFFAEFHLNRELRPEEYPAVYAHELAHRLGISSEAEANFYAWLVCSRSEVPAIRYSGSVLLLGYVLNNASVLLTQEEFQQTLHTIRPEILQQYRSRQIYWQNKYSPFIGKIQNRIYHFFLKSNRVPGGTKNYSQVIGLIISYQNHFSS